MTMVMQKKIGAGEFKAKCLQILDEVEARRTSYLVTKRGRAVAKVVAIPLSTGRVFSGIVRTFEITGDIVSPTGEEWNAER